MELRSEDRSQNHHRKLESSRHQFGNRTQHRTRPWPDMALGASSTALGSFHGNTCLTRDYRPPYPRQWVPSGFLKENLGVKKKGYYISIKELVLGIMKYIRTYSI